MTAQKITDLNVLSTKLIPTPDEIKQKIPLGKEAAATTTRGREDIQNILDRKDRRIFVVVGPCSIHDLDAALEYASRLKDLQQEVAETMLLVMRVYFAKPRTSVGWKGFINDPFLDDSFRIDEGMRLARQLLSDIASMGVPTATEALDSITPQYVDDLLSWNAIGARTTESQSHREMASGLSTPVGFKNGTDGNIEIAINAIRSCASSHHFLGINGMGQCCVLETRGNRYGHIVLRGGAGRPNYDSVCVTMCEKELEAAKLPINITIDASHGNSLKDPALQPLVFENCVTQILAGNRSIVGLMLESHLNFGAQSFQKGAKLGYGVSITDACLDWERTATCLKQANERLAPVLPQRF